MSHKKTKISKGSIFASIMEWTLNWKMRHFVKICKHCVFVIFVSDRHFFQNLFLLHVWQSLSKNASILGYENVVYCKK